MEKEGPKKMGWLAQGHVAGWASGGELVHSIQSYENDETFTSAQSPHVPPLPPSHFHLPRKSNLQWTDSKQIYTDLPASSFYSL